MWFPALSSGVLESIITIYKAQPHSREVSPKAVDSTPVALRGCAGAHPGHATSGM